MKPDKIRIINGDENTLFDNTEEAKDVLMDLILNNDTITFHSSDIVDGVMTIEI